MLGITQDTVATCHELIDHTEELTPRMEFKANVQLYAVKTYMILAATGDQKKESEHESVKFPGTGAKALEDRLDFGLLPHTGNRE